MRPLRKLSAPIGRCAALKAASGVSCPRFISSPKRKKSPTCACWKRWQKIQANEVRYKEYYLEDAEIVVVGFGTAGRVALSAVRAARAEGIPVGLLRPITSAPSRPAQIARLKRQGILVVEMNTGQMLEDVRLAVVASKSRSSFTAAWAAWCPSRMKSWVRSSAWPANRCRPTATRASAG
jgi:hypothetical protein